jgi:modulator of FtsH protease
MALSAPFTAEWNTFLAVQASAAATLSGLVFVAVSINLTKILAIPGLPGRAAESLMQFLQAFFVSTLMLIPGQPQWTLAHELLIAAIILWILQVVGQIRYLRLRTRQPLSWFMPRAILAQIANVPFLIAGIALLLNAPGALYWLVPGFVFSFVAGILSAWVLLVEILR